MDIRQIVKDYLKKNNYDGLVQGDWECGCEITDLMPCDEAPPSCEAGYKRKSKNPEYDWVISTSKPFDYDLEKAILPVEEFIKLNSINIKDKEKRICFDCGEEIDEDTLKQFPDTEICLDCLNEE